MIKNSAPRSFFHTKAVAHVTAVVEWPRIRMEQNEAKRGEKHQHLVIWRPALLSGAWDLDIPCEKPQVSLPITVVSKIPKFPCDIFRPWPSARTWSEQWKRAKSSPCGTCRPQGIYHHLPRGAFPKPERIVSFRHPLNGTMWYPKWKVHGEGVKRCWMLSKWQTRSSSISTSKSIKN